eukprot:758322-Hanusia_phi.AAC.5
MRRRLGGCLLVVLLFCLSMALADVCGKQSEDVWEGPCKGGMPEGDGTYKSANGVGEGGERGGYDEMMTCTGGLQGEDEEGRPRWGGDMRVAKRGEVRGKLAGREAVG